MQRSIKDMNLDQLDTEQLASAIDQTVDDCITKAQRAFQRAFAKPDVSFALKGKTAGKALLEDNEIRLNPVLLLENTDAFIEDVIPHEIAHLITHQVFGRVKPHGKEWQYVMTSVFGVAANTTHRFSLDSVRGITFEYRCDCQTHPLTIRRHNKVQRQQATYLCRRCNTHLQFTGVQLS